MTSGKKAPKFSDLHKRVAHALQRLFYGEDDGDERVPEFLIWARKQEQGFLLPGGKVYPIIAGSQHPSWDFVVAILSYTDDPDLHALLKPSKSAITKAVATLRTHADGLYATADRLEGKASGSTTKEQEPK